MLSRAYVSYWDDRVAMLGIHDSDVARLPGNKTRGELVDSPPIRTKVRPEDVSINFVSDSIGHALDLSVYKA